MVLFGEALGTLEDEDQLTEVGHWQQVLEGVLCLVPFGPTLLLLSHQKAKISPPCSLLHGFAQVYGVK